MRWVRTLRNWLVDLVIEYWTTIAFVIGAGLMTFLASISSFLNQYGPVAWGGGRNTYNAIARGSGDDSCVGRACLCKGTIPKNNGDILVVDRSIEARDGHVLVAEYAGGYTVKHLSMCRRKIRLLPENPDYPPIEFKDGQELVVFGMVTNVIHSIKQPMRLMAKPACAT